MGVSWIGNFEKGDLTGYYSYQNVPEVVHKDDGYPVRDGNYSMRCYLHRYESQYSYRTDVHIGADDEQPFGTKEVYIFSIGSEYWYGFSIYLPSDWVADKYKMHDVIVQWLATPDDGEIYRSPVLCIATEEDKWQIITRWDSRKTSPPENVFEGSQTYYFDYAGDLGSWTDFVINVKWSYGSDGFLKVWKGGELIIDRTGPNCSNDNVGPYMQMGVYKWSWKDGYKSNTDQRELYIDELRIGDSAASYGDVAPGGAQPNGGDQVALLAGGQSVTFSDLDPGTYILTAAVPQGWQVAQNDIEVVLGIGEAVTITFQFSKMGSITVTVITEPSEATQEFEITLIKTA